jgi:hypothetical protein
MTDELKEAFDYQADSHVFMFQRQPMLRSMDLSNQVAMPEAPQDQSAPMDMSMPSEADAPEPVEPLYTEDQLALMPEWISGSKKMFSVMNDGQRFIGSDKQAAAYGLDLMSEFNWNMTGPTGIPGESGISAPGFAFQVAALMSDEAGEENALTFLQMLNTYSDTATNGATIKRAFRGIFADPLTYAGIVGKFASMGIRASAGFAKGPIKDMLMKTATGIAMPYDLGVKYPGRAGMAAGAGYGMGFEGGTMGVEQAAGAGPTVDEAARRLATAGAVGAGVGGLMGKGLSASAPVVAKGLDTVGQAAEARMAQRGPITDRVMSGVDPMEVIDPVLAGLGRIARSEQPTAGLSQASDAPGIGGLSPEYRVTVDAFEPEGTGKQSMVPIKLTPKNSEKVKPAMEQIEQEFPDPLASPQSYATMVAKMQNKKEVSMPPSWMIEHANNPEKWADWFGQITPDQIKAADEGLAVQQKFVDAYTAGSGPELTGQLMLWAILSRRMSAFPHEAGYLELAEAAQPFIQKAARGEWSDADTAAWRKMSMSIQPEGAPGKSATSNANDFGEVFLKKMSAVDENGVSALTHLHNLIADQSKSSKEIRREYYSLAEGTGIGNKILSFALLVSGRNDVVVLDRIQINQMWGGGDKIYDDIMKQFEGAQGLVQYEALERSLLNRVPDLYNRLGRGDVGSVGRYHWESWVRSSGQVVSHPTLEAVVGMGSKRPGANFSPTEMVPVTEGRFHTKYSGVSYEKMPGSESRFIYNTSDGKPYQFTKAELDGMFDQVFSKKSGILPEDFPGVQSFEGGSIPWYEFEGVDRGKLDQLIRAKGKPAEQY